MPEITISPLPPQQGNSATVCYSGGTLPVTLTLTWTPANAGPATLTIPAPKDDVDTNCVELTIPGNATALSITDPTPNGADEESTAIST